MDISDIKRWQWALVGILAGLALGYAWSSGDPAGDGRKISQIDFERDLIRKDPKSNEPVLEKIVVHPAVLDYQKQTVQPVTFLRTMRGGKDGKSYKVWAQFVAPVPYQPQFNGAGAAPVAGKTFTVSDYLAAVSKQAPEVRYRFGWESQKPVAMAAWTVGSVLLVGGIWPTLLNLLIGAGLGAKREQKKEDYFARFSSTPEPAKAAARAAMSDAERDRLDEMNRRLEADLASEGLGMTSVGAERPATPNDVRKLEGGPVEAAPALKRGDEDDEIEVKGVYYPVLIHHKKKKDEAHDPAKDGGEPSKH